MSSFTRTIPADKTGEEVIQILSRPDHYVPLTFHPQRALSGDFIYLVHHGVVVARARLTAIEPVTPVLQAGAAPPPAWARWLVRYAGPWQLPPRRIPIQGHQGVRYLEQHALAHLDAEQW